MGFFATIGRGWEMSKLSMSVVKKDPELMVYMIFAGVMSLACLVGMSIPQLFEMEWAVNADSSFTGAYLGFTFIAYMVLSIIVVFWNCAIFCAFVCKQPRRSCSYSAHGFQTVPLFKFGVVQF